jgi:hypothetical protein
MTVGAGSSVPVPALLISAVPLFFDLYPFPRAPAASVMSSAHATRQSARSGARGSSAAALLTFEGGVAWGALCWCWSSQQVSSVNSNSSSHESVQKVPTLHANTQEKENKSPDQPGLVPAFRALLRLVRVVRAALGSSRQTSQWAMKVFCVVYLENKG